MATRLTEAEVHSACVEIATQGERPTSLNLLDKLGRGSLTTITKHLNSWNTSDDAQAIEAESLPAVIKLPDELSREGDDLLKKMWNIAKDITDSELDIQREALKQAEIGNQEKVEEAFKFSEAQSLKIERMEEEFNAIKSQLDTEFSEHNQTESKLYEAEKDNIGLSKDNEQLRNEIESFKSQVAALEETNKSANQNKQAMQENYSKEIKAKEGEIRVLEIELGKVNEKISSSVLTNNKLISDLKDKSSELKKANKIASDAEKMVAKLEGKLEVYSSIENRDK